MPYFSPKIAWWESDPKFTIRIPAQVVNSSGRALEADILDLSRLGCFVKCRPDFSEDEVVKIRCRLFGREWTAGGVVVWKTFGAVTHPRGIGVKFGAMERPAARILKAAAVKLGKRARDRKTKACAFCGVARIHGNPFEGTAKLGKRVFRNADSGIFNIEIDRP